MRGKTKQVSETGFEGRRKRRSRNEWEQNKGEITRYRGVGMKTFKKMKQYRE
jgi:hypothetical protein